MVKRLEGAPSGGGAVKPRRSRWLLPIALVGFILYFSLPPFLQKDENGDYVLSEERWQEYQEKAGRSDKVEVYKLVATTAGLYPCLNCEGRQTVWLNPGEVWKYGISRNGKARYTKALYEIQKVEYIRITTTDILTAEKMEKKLIISYPLLPECQVRMKKHQIFLKRPPGNAKDA